MNGLFFDVSQGWFLAKCDATPSLVGLAEHVLACGLTLLPVRLDVTTARVGIVFPTGFVHLGLSSQLDTPDLMLLFDSLRSLLCHEV